QYIAGPVQDKAEIVYADLDLGKIAEGNLALDTDGHYSRPDVFRLEVNEAPQANVSFQNPGK
ncbi:MAG: nitrilase, partial [Gammaproteobacteria bacterium]|nr:nitrilase [Gammaproteobacteria bacterium]